VVVIGSKQGEETCCVETGRLIFVVGITFAGGIVDVVLVVDVDVVIEA